MVQAMSMSHSEAGRMSRNSQIQAKIEELCAPYRPKEIMRYDEDGKMVRVVSAGYADGSQSYNRVR